MKIIKTNVGAAMASAIHGLANIAGFAIGLLREPPLLIVGKIETGKNSHAMSPAKTRAASTIGRADLPKLAGVSGEFDIAADIAGARLDLRLVHPVVAARIEHACLRHRLAPAPLMTAQWRNGKQ